jgi:hypothetical protein
MKPPSFGGNFGVVAVIIAVNILGGAKHVIGQPPHVAEGKRLQTIIAAALRDNGERLQRCQFRASGQRWQLDSKLGDIDSPIEHSADVDWGEQRMRFESIASVRISDDTALDPKLGPGNWHLEPRISRWLTTPADNAYVTPSGVDGPIKIVICKADDASGRRATDAFDIRTIGLVTMEEWKSFAGLDEALQYFQRQRFTRGTEHADGLIILESQTTTGGSLKWFDTKHGNMPVRDEYTFLGNRAYLAEVTWTKTGDIWVPQTYHHERYKVSESPPQKYETLDLAFEWISVNQPLPDALWKVDSLGTSTSQLVVDRRGDRPVTIKKIVPPGAEPPPMRVVVPRQSSNLKLILIGNAVFLGLLVVLLLVRHRRNQRAASK